MLFCILGTLQLFMLLQARLMAEYAVYRAVRAGSLSHGDCKRMTEAAVLSLLPAVTATDSDAKLANALKLRRNNRYDAGRDGGHGGAARRAVARAAQGVGRGRPRGQELRSARPPDALGDAHGLLVPPQDPLRRLGALADVPRALGLKPYANANPLMMANARARWSAVSTLPGNGMAWPGGPLSTSMLAWEAQGQRLFPIQVNFGMRMMTPAKKKYFAGQGCAL